LDFALLFLKKISAAGYYSKMINDVHMLMRNADDIDAAFCNSIENDMSPFWKTIIAVFNAIPSFV